MVVKFGKSDKEGAYFEITLYFLRIGVRVGDYLGKILVVDEPSIEKLSRLFYKM